MEKKIYIKKLLLIILFFTTTIIILSNSNLSYGASLSVRNDREPRIVCKKTDKNYLYITLHDSSGIILDSAEATLAGKKCKYVLIEVSDGIYTLKGKRIKDIIRSGGSYSGKKYDYGIKIKNTDLSSKEFKDLYIYSYDYGHACFIKETLKVKKYDAANKDGEYYCVNRAPRATVHAIDNKVKVDAVDYTGIKSIKIVSKKSNEVVYSYAAGKVNDSTKNQKGINKDGNFYPYKVVEDIDMKLIEKAQKDKPGRYRFRVFVEDASGIKSEKTMTSTVSQTNTNTNTNTNPNTNPNRNTDSSDNTNRRGEEKLLKSLRYAYKFSKEAGGHITYIDSSTGDHRNSGKLEKGYSDCSWYVFRVYEHTGMMKKFVRSLEWGHNVCPRTKVVASFKKGQKWDYSNASPGDVIWEHYGGGRHNHVYIYLGNGLKIGCSAGHASGKAVNVGKVRRANSSTKKYERKIIHFKDFPYAPNSYFDLKTQTIKYK